MNWLVLTLNLCLLMTQETQPPSSVEITLKARAETPGEIILVTVGGEQPLTSVGGKAFGHDVRFFEVGKPNTWQALVGIDVEVRPGEYPLDVTVVDASGVQTHATRVLQISRRVFSTRHLTLPEKYVNPPRQVEERIRREAEEVKAILASVSPERLWTGTFRRPVPGSVISTFGKRSVLNGQPRSIHAGIDLRAPVGTPVKAPAGGRVVLAKDLYFAGNSIILDHGLGFYSQFAHLSAFDVKEGQVVEAGEIIGRTGQTGRVQGPHLHWSVRVGNARVDPEAVFVVLGP